MRSVGDAGDLAGSALSTNGRQAIGYLCDVTGRHVSLAQWFMGPVTGTGIEQTGALIVSPLLDNLVSVTVPGVGTFRLTHCLRARC